MNQVVHAFEPSSPYGDPLTAAEVHGMNSVVNIAAQFKMHMASGYMTKAKRVELSRQIAQLVEIANELEQAS